AVSASTSIAMVDVAIPLSPSIFPASDRPPRPEDNCLRQTPAVLVGPHQLLALARSALEQAAARRQTTPPASPSAATPAPADAPPRSGPSPDRPPRSSTPRPDACGCIRPGGMGRPALPSARPG